MCFHGLTFYRRIHDGSGRAYGAVEVGIFVIFLQGSKNINYGINYLGAVL